MLTSIFGYKCMMNDRFGFFDKFSIYKWKHINELPDFDLLIDQNIEDLIDERAQEIINFAGSKTIYVLFSGGVDSTTVVSALIKNRSSNTKIELLYTTESLKENPYFFNFIKQFDFIKCTLLEFEEIYKYIENHKSPEYILTNGWGSDQIHGYRSINEYPEFQNKNWRDCLNEILKRKNLYQFERVYKYSLDIIEDRIKSIFPKPIRTFSEYGWFYNFSFKYTYIRDVVNLEADTDYLRQNNFPFFCTEKFSNWSLYQFLTDRMTLDKYSSDSTQYKRGLKNYTIKITGDTSFLYMEKHTSWNPMYDKVGDLRCVIHDTDGYKNLGSVKSWKDKSSLLTKYLR